MRGAACSILHGSPAGAPPCLDWSPAVGQELGRVEATKPHRPVAALYKVHRTNAADPGIRPREQDCGSGAMHVHEEGRAMRRSIIAGVVAVALVTGWSLPTAAQQNGVVIQNNG